MFVLTIILTVVVLLLSSCYWYQTRSRYANLLNKFPQYTNFIPILGNNVILGQNQETLFKKLKTIYGSFNETFAVWAGIYGTLQIVTAEDAEIILSNVKYIDKGFVYDMLQSWLGTGLLTSTGKKWHHRRKMLTPSFHYNILQIFVRNFGRHCENLVEGLRTLCKEEKTNIMPLISKTTLNTICDTSMGIKFNENDQMIKCYRNSLNNYCEIVIKRMFCPWLFPDVLYNLFPLSWEEKKTVKLLHKYTKQVIKTREDQFEDSDVMDLDSKSKETLTKKRLAMLDLLISAKRRQEIDDEGIREEVDTFVFEGHDTTYVGITFALMLLANHKDVQEKVIEELDNIFGDSNRHPTYDDLQNMKYLECCLKESLRLYPSVPTIARKIYEDVPLTKHVAPADTNVFIQIYYLHRDPRYFPDPEKFDPSRFLPENCKGRHPYAYIPFSAGPRNCIGQKFAMLELKSIASSILRNFRMEAVDTPEDLTLLTDIILRVKGPIYIKFVPRT